jgi:secondary-alcohol dehydrogenase (coenzyme-F420)
VKTKVGYFASIEQYSPTEALRQAIKADQMGFDSVWVDDHFHPWSHTSAAGGFAWSWMASALQATKHVSISTCCTCPTMRYNPSITAQAFATMGYMYPGRVMLALGSGEPINESTITGQWYPTPVRQEMMCESIDLIKKLWTSDDLIDFHGKYFNLYGGKLYTRPEKKVPIYFSAVGPNAARMAGQWGDHLITGGPGEHIKTTVIPTFEKSAKASGKDPSKMERAMLQWYSVDPDMDKALEGIRFWGGCVHPSCLTDKNMTDPRDVEKLGKQVSCEMLGQMFWVATDAEGVIKKMEEYRKAGITHFALGNSSPKVDFGMDVLKDVIAYYKDQNTKN